MKETDNLSLTRAVLQAVRNLGSCTISEVLAEVGHLISAPRAIRRHRIHYEGIRRRAGYQEHRAEQTAKNMAERGRKKVITDTLIRLCHDGHLERVARGQYRVPQNGKPA